MAVPIQQSRGGLADSGRIDWQAELRKHERWLRTVVAARVQQPQAVEDVMQEVALAAVRQAAPIENPAKIAPWLYRLAIRQVLLHRRKEGRQRKLLDRYAHQLPRDRAAGDPDPLDWLLAEERKRMVREAVQQLPEKDSEILMLKYREGWSYQQIADHLGVSQSAVEARLHRARHRLRDQLVRSEATGATA